MWSARTVGPDCAAARFRMHTLLTCYKQWRACTVCVRHGTAAHCHHASGTLQAREQPHAWMALDSDGKSTSMDGGPSDRPTPAALTAPPATPHTPAHIASDLQRRMARRREGAPW